LRACWPIAGIATGCWFTPTLAQALILAALVLAGTIHIEEIVALSLLLGPVNAFDMPTRQSFLVQLSPQRPPLSPSRMQD
jgi:hypothetical protein